MENSKRGGCLNCPKFWGQFKIEFCQFRECSVLEKIKLPSSVTEIGWGAFRSCENLTEIVIPNSVTEIGPKAFEGGASLKRIKLPKQLKRDDIRDGLKIPETTEIEYY
ncbi:MAG: leucine-rich repeat domain-containing protein [Treponema sp.]|nr:leucine-rich repeat domain-containing protein [Treponema sp.]